MAKTKDVRFVNWMGLPPGFQPIGWTGMIYSITNLMSNRKYIGKKFFWFKRRVKIKGKKRCKVVVSESDWKTYQSSSDEVKADIKKLGIENFRFEVLSLHKSKKDLSYAEVKLQFKLGVLESKDYYNSNILGRFFKQ